MVIGMSRQRRFTAGERVTVEIDGKQVEGVFVRFAEQQQGVNAKGGAAPGDLQLQGVGWVRRSDTGEVEPFAYELITGA
jgi:hypothetical protein